VWNATPQRAVTLLVFLLPPQSSPVYRPPSPLNQNRGSCVLCPVENADQLCLDNNRLFMEGKTLAPHLTKRFHTNTSNCQGLRVVLLGQGNTGIKGF
jgi:hypothetical protein